MADSPKKILIIEDDPPSPLGKLRAMEGEKIRLESLMFKYG